jgi:hypothetical protein
VIDQRLHDDVGTRHDRVFSFGGCWDRHRVSP